MDNKAFTQDNMNAHLDKLRDKHKDQYNQQVPQSDLQLMQPQIVPQ